MDTVKLITSLDWPAVLGMVILVWYFTSDLRKSTAEILREIKSMHDDLKIMNTRISRVEGTIYGNQVYKNVGE